ncbi:dehydrogenase/reductase SDR family member 4-like [Gastrophryne carolinensis]
MACTLDLEGALDPGDGNRGWKRHAPPVKKFADMKYAVRQKMNTCKQQKYTISVDCFVCPYIIWSPYLLVLEETFIMQSAKEVQTRKFQGKSGSCNRITDGIGLAIARRLAQDGAQVLICSRKQENVDRTVKELKAEGLDVEGTVCDIGLSKDREGLVDTAVQKFGGIDIFISNAGLDHDFCKTLDCTEDMWDELLNANVKAPFFLTKLVVPKMQERGGGSIVFITSITVYAPYPGLGPYDVSKTALLGLMKSLAPELSPLNIRVNGIAPGIMHTSSTAVVWKDESLLDKTLTELRVSRMGEPEECAGLASFLCSSEASYITGENIVVGGGSPNRL